MRKLTYYVAVSADGYVARSDGGLSDFEFDGEHVADLLAEYPETIPTHMRPQLNVADQNRHFDTVLMGRNTYQVGVDMGVTNPYAHLRQFVFSSSLPSVDPDVTIVPEDATEVVRSLKREAGLGIWLCGGPTLAASLLGEIDEVTLKVNSFLMGRGMPLFGEEFPKRELKLIHRKDYTNGFSIIRYALEATP